MPSTSTSSRFDAHREHYLKLQLHFRGQLRAQLKPLAQAIGIGENTVRNGGNIVRINGREVRPAIVNGRLTYDLAEVAEALAATETDVEIPVPKVQPPRGRPRKAGLEVTGSAA